VKQERYSGSRKNILRKVVNEHAFLTVTNIWNNCRAFSIIPYLSSLLAHARSHDKAGVKRSWCKNAAFVGFEVPTAEVMKNSIFWDITPCSPLKVNRRFGGTCRLLPPAFTLVSCSAYCATLKMEATCSS
jgi:hypothetical protein